MIRRGGALLLAVAAAYLVLATGAVGGGDNAEFATLGAVGGAAHPSGYPLYVLWLRAVAWLPGSPAHAAALATAILAVAQLAVLHAAARAWGARPTGASLAVALYAAAPLVLRLATEAEVFALNGLVVAGVLWLAAERGPLQGGRRAFALGLVAGLGLANHMTCVLVAPVGLLGAVRAVREARARVGAIALALGGLALGLLPYAYLLVAPRTAASWGDLRTLGDVVDTALRRDYGGPTGLATIDPAAPAAAPIAANEWALLLSLARAWWGVPALAGLALLIVRCARRAPATLEPRAGWCALAASALLAGPLLLARFNLAPDTAVFLSIVERFHVLPTLLLAIPVAVALDAITARLRPALGAAAAVGLFGAALAASLPRLAAQHSAIVDDGLHNLALSLPPDAVLIVSPDDLVFGMRYLQVAQGARPDVHVVAWRLMGLPWYARREAAEGFPIPPGEGDPEVRFAASILARGRPLVVDDLEPAVVAALPHYPIGGLVRVLPRGAAIPALDDLLAQNQALFLHAYTLAPTPAAADDWAAEAYIRYARTWAELGQLLEAAGRADDAGRAYGLASQLHPTP